MTDQSDVKLRPFPIAEQHWVPLRAIRLIEDYRRIYRKEPGRLIKKRCFKAAQQEWYEKQREWRRSHE
jgi:hypothetical protein